MALSKSPFYWIGEVPPCDFCGRPIADEFVDARTKSGPWAIMCPSCHRTYGVPQTLGLGVGQRYRRQPDGKFLKVEG